jgi:hypothetical protein
MTATTLRMITYQLTPAPWWYEWCLARRPARRSRASAATTGTTRSGTTVKWLARPGKPADRSSQVVVHLAAGARWSSRSPSPDSTRGAYCAGRISLAPVFKSIAYPSLPALLQLERVAQTYEPVVFR